MCYYSDNIKGIKVVLESLSTYKGYTLATGSVKGIDFDLFGSSLTLKDNLDCPPINISDSDLQFYLDAVEETIRRVRILEEEAFLIEMYEEEQRIRENADMEMEYEGYSYRRSRFQPAE